MYVLAKDGTRLFVRDWGDGDPLLFVAGMGVSSDLWTHTLPHFIEAGYRCISFDRRGHGRSDEPRGGWDMDTLASDLGSVADRLELTRFAVIGHSLGGAESIRYVAGDGRDRVTKLVLLAATAPYLAKTADNPDGVDRALIEMQWNVWRKDFPGWVRANARPFFDEATSDAMVDWGVDLLTRVSLPVQLALGRVAVDTDLRDDLQRVLAPTLVLHGDRDASVPIAFGRLAASLIKRSRFKAYPSAAHGLFITHATEVVPDIVTFLRADAPTPL